MLLSADFILSAQSSIIDQLAPCLNLQFVSLEMNLLPHQFGCAQAAISAEFIPPYEPVSLNRAGTCVLIQL